MKIRDFFVRLSIVIVKDSFVFSASTRLGFCACSYHCLIRSDQFLMISDCFVGEENQVLGYEGFDFLL